jgi:major membrane immunogen (membrane-anchored lipoprotein)
MIWSPQAGYDPPTGGLKPLAQSATVLFSGVYARQTGNLAVTLSPAQAVDAGAKWRRTGTLLWRDSTVNETALPTGNYTVEFKPTAGWTTPGTKVVTVSKGQTAQATGAYVRQTGSLKVTITPAAAVSAGAQWHRAGTSTWLASGSTEKSVPTGDYMIEFKAVAGWKAPANVNVIVNNGQTVQLSRIYRDIRNAVPGGAWRLYGQ